MDALLHQIWLARWPLAWGVATTVQVAVAAIALGTLVGVGAGIQLTYGGALARAPLRLYVEVMRGTPLLVSILAAFYVPAVAGVTLSATAAGTLALALFAAAHVAEIVRGALQAIPRAQAEAARSIGLTFPQTFTYVLLPQALPTALPPWINTAVELVKGTSLLSIIGVSELLLATQEIIGRTFMTIEFYLVCGLLYLVVNVSLDLTARRLDRRWKAVHGR